MSLAPLLRRPVPEPQAQRTPARRSTRVSLGGLRVGSPNSAHEREADRIADQVLRGATRSMAVHAVTPEIQRVCAACHDDEEVKRSPADAGSAPVVHSGVARQINERRGGGTPIPEPLRRDMETRFGQPFEHVRVHTDDTSSRLTRQLKARAFTVGDDIFFRRGELSPSSRGQRLLAHELTHVLQQSGHGVVRRKPDDEAGPAVAVKPTCQALGFVEGEIEQAITHARLKAAFALGSLDALHTLDDGEREALWNSGSYRCWFGVYKRSRFKQIRRVMGRVVRALERSSLKIDCNEEPDWAEAWPGVSKIVLSAVWRDSPSKYEERVQTFVHEAAHIAGMTIRKEGRFAAVSDLLSTAASTPELTPRIAEAYGWFAMRPHKIYPACS